MSDAPDEAPDSGDSASTIFLRARRAAQQVSSGLARALEAAVGRQVRLLARVRRRVVSTTRRLDQQLLEVRRQQEIRLDATDDGLVGLGQLPAKFIIWFDNLREWLVPGRRRQTRPPVSGGWRRTASVAAAIFLLYFSINLVLNHVEPFGLDVAAKAQSARTSARMMAPFYRSDAQDHIAVVLINKETLQARQMGWPPRYSYYAEVLRRVMKQKPRAIYIDMVVQDKRDYDDSLQIANDDITNTMTNNPGVPVWFGVSARTGTTLFMGVPGVSEATAAWQGLGDQYPLRIEAANVVESSQERVAADSVALLLYRAACSNSGSGCAQPAHELSTSEQSIPMHVLWGSLLPTQPAGTPERNCTRAHGTLFSSSAAWYQAMRGAWLSFREGADPKLLDAQRVRCPYTFTLFEDELDDPDPMWLRDRVVLIGTQLDGMDDSVASPVHQRLPGVYLHAMALDNLMTWGDRRLHRRGTGFMTMYSVLVAGLVSFALACILRYVHGIPRVVALLILALLATVGSIVFQQWVLRAPPLDWLLALGLFSLIMFAFMNGRRDVAPSEHSK